MVCHGGLCQDRCQEIAHCTAFSLLAFKLVFEVCLLHLPRGSNPLISSKYKCCCPTDEPCSHVCSRVGSSWATEPFQVASKTIKGGIACSHGFTLPSMIFFSIQVKSVLQSRYHMHCSLFYYILQVSKTPNVVLGRFGAPVRKVQCITLFSGLSLLRKLDLL